MHRTVLVLILYDLRIKLLLIGRKTEAKVGKSSRVREHYGVRNSDRSVDQFLDISVLQHYCHKVIMIFWRPDRMPCANNGIPNLRLVVLI